MIKIITDSTAYIPEEYIKENDIVVLPLTVTLNEEEFLDNDTSRYQEFYQKVEASKSSPQTSQPNINLITKAFQKVIDDNNEAIVLSISNTLSGTVNTLNFVKNEIDKNNQITVIDSGTVAQTMFCYIKDAVEMIKQNKSREEITKHLYDLQENSALNFIPENLEALKRGGRIGKLNFIIGNILHIKPILSFKKGVLSCVKKVIGIKSAMSNIVKSIPKKVKEIVVLKISKSEYFEEFKNIIKTAYPNVPISEGDVGPVVGTHVGKAIGISCIAEKVA